MDRKRRRARSAAAAAAGLLLGTFAWPVERPPPAHPAEATLSAAPVPLDEGDAERRRVGGLVYLGGWHLESRDVRFGGISAMDVEGDTIIAVSDAGSLLRFPVPRRAADLPLRIDRVPHGPGAGRRKGDRDAEALAIAGDHAWLAFEGRNAIWRYRRGDWRFEAAAAPAAMRAWPAMGGAEAMVRLGDGRFLVLAEGPVADDGTTPAVLFGGDPALAATPATALRYRPPPGYRITDAALLPDGRLLFLNRRVSWLGGVSAILTVGNAPAPPGGAAVEGRELAVLAGSLTVDNMEALSVTTEAGRTIVWIASDDNFNPLFQRTLLLKFALAQ